MMANQEHQLVLLQKYKEDVRNLRKRLETVKSGRDVKSLKKTVAALEKKVRCYELALAYLETQDRLLAQRVRREYVSNLARTR